MRIAVLWAGGVGGYFVGRLASAGTDVTFVARGAHLEAMRSKGLQRPLVMMPASVCVVPRLNGVQPLTRCECTESGGTGIARKNLGEVLAEWPAFCFELVYGGLHMQRCSATSN
jgi:hypothetical protein